MTAPLVVLAPESAYVRKTLFALEVLDGVTLSRLNEGLKVVAEGLQGKPILNAGGLFVWLEEDFSALKKLTIDPQRLPYERLELAPAGVDRPLTRVELRPGSNYVFTSGITGLRGRLVESRTADPRVSVADADVLLRWLDEDGVTWHDTPIASRTNAEGDFAVVLRPVPTDVPSLDGDGAVTVQLVARRGVLGTRRSGDLKLTPGRVAEPYPTHPSGPDFLTFAWNDLLP